MKEELKAKIEDNLTNNNAEMLTKWVIGMYEMFENAGATEEFLHDYLVHVMSEENIRTCQNKSTRTNFSRMHKGPDEDKPAKFFEYIQGLCDKYGVEYAMKAWEYSKDFVDAEREKCKQSGQECTANYFDGVIRYVVQTNPHDVHFEVSNGSINESNVAICRLTIGEFPVGKLSISENEKNYMEFEFVHVRTNLQGIKLGKMLVLETIKAAHKAIPDAGIMAGAIEGNNASAYYTYASIGGQMRYNEQDYSPAELDEMSLDRNQILEVYYEQERLDDICNRSVEITPVDPKYLCEAQKREIEGEATM